MKADKRKVKSHVPLGSPLHKLELPLSRTSKPTIPAEAIVQVNQRSPQKEKEKAITTAPFGLEQFFATLGD